MSNSSFVVLLISQLSPSLGRQKSEAIVKAAIQSLNLNPDTLTSTDARAVFGKIAEQPGLVGLAARQIRGGGPGQSGAPAELDVNIFS